MGPVALAETVREVLGSSFQVAVKPDFPHLAVAPDILIGGSGKLVGIFLPTKDEWRDTTRLLVRLALARLGLPPHLVCVVVQCQPVGEANRADRERWASIEANFDGWSDVQGMRKKVRAFVEAEPVARGAGYAAARKQCQLRYALLAEVSTEFKERHPDDRSPPEILDQLVAQFGYSSTAPCNLWGSSAGTRTDTDCLPVKRVTKNGFTVSSVGFQDGPSPTRELLPYVTLSVQNDYSFNNGVPYPRDFAVKCLAVARFPRGARDPGKLMRAAAFAGWALLRVPSAQHAVQLMRDIQAQLRASELILETAGCPVGE